MKQPLKPNQVDGSASRSIGRTIKRNDGAECPSALAKDRAMTPRVTGAEERVLQWVSRGKSNKEIAAVLGISPATVKRHLETLLMKLGMRNRVELAIYGLTAACPHDSIGGCVLRQFGRDSGT